jgi:hypothetical protein
MFSDLTGRFPATAIDGSQYLLFSVYKKYIHIELLASRAESSIIDAYSRTYQWFSQFGHFVQFQVMDNEAPKGLRQHFITSNIKYEFVPPFTKRSNKAERAIQTFKRHFIAILAGTHPSFPINFWHEIIPPAEHIRIPRHPPKAVRLPQPPAGSMRNAHRLAQLHPRNMGQLRAHWFLPRARIITLSLISLPRTRNQLHLHL